jgi:hypothetical protein
MITVVLFNWKRPRNVHRILKALKGQRHVSQIWVWNNGEPEQFDCDWQIDSTENTNCRSLAWLWRMADTPFVAKIDDDIIPFCSHCFAMGVQTLKDLERPPLYRVVGPFGVVLRRDGRYKGGRHIARQIKVRASADFIKGRLMLMRREAVDLLPATFPDANEDLRISIAVAQGRRKNQLICKYMQEKTHDMPEGNVGLCNSPETRRRHWEERDRISREWLRSL